MILSAFLLDLLLGDPRYGFHPVILIGKLVRFVEKKMNKGSFLFLRGLLSAMFVIGTVFCLSLFLEKEIEKLPSLIALLLKSVLLYTTFALRDLIDHALRVYNSLKKNNLKDARFHLSYMVGRKTDNLAEREICRAVIESVAENLVDGVTAPLFYAFLFGLSGAFVYKTINTLDSYWGHRNERFEKFGKFAARLDDVANWIPARVTAPVIAFSSFFITGNFWKSLKIFIRDGKKHPSPNSGLSEAAMAGALGVQLGGHNEYEGYQSFRTYLGENENPLTVKSVKDALLIIFLGGIFFFLLFEGAHFYVWKKIL